MSGRKRKAPRRAATGKGVDDIYQDMLAEAGAVHETSSPARSPPRKRKRPGDKPVDPNPGDAQPEPEALTGEDDDIEFEDVPIPAPQIQTLYRDSEDEETDEEDIEFEDVNIDMPVAPMVSAQPATDIELNLTAHRSSTAKKVPDRRKPLTKEERERRLDVHRTHVLCLLIHCARRNRWCNDAEVQKSLRPLLTTKIMAALRPKSNLNQFGRTESLKDGLQQLSKVFKIRFQVTERGLRRCLWADRTDDLLTYELPDDIDSCISLAEFREAAANLRGSRDVGAQLLCALLRCAGLQARLVCSLQALTFTSGGPALQVPRIKKTPTKKTVEESMQNVRASHEQPPPELSRAARRRLAYTSTPTAAAPPPPSPVEKINIIKESPYPVYWVEVLDVAHQKWQPLDPLVTDSMWKTAKLEPPASDRENCMSYVLAFDSDGTAKDVTRRYAKAYAAKTRKLRVESVMENGQRWWRKALKPFARRWPTDLDQIENNELAATESREPMPRNVADFKGHPTFALERHLRRHEVLVPGAQPTGTVGAGSKGPLEKVYRRRDVRVARSRDKWYRMGREVKPMELPVKFIPLRENAKVGDYVDDGFGGDERDAAGTPLFMMEQTEVFKHPPVVRGRVPKNKFGNIDLYVPSMVPEGGVYIPDEGEDSALAARAAFILGLDYAPALTGFSFKGRQGTAVLNGVVVAKEYEEAVRAAIDGLGDMEAQRAAEVRAVAAVRMWKRFLVALRIRERVYAGVDPEERRRDEEKVISRMPAEPEEEDEGLGAERSGEEAISEAALDDALDDAASDVTEEYLMDEDDMGGGFMEEEDMGGGFMAD